MKYKSKLLVAIVVIFSCLCLIGCGKKTFTVTFDSNGGNNIDDVIIDKDKTVSKPTGPTKEGYEFEYWTKNGKKYDFSTAIKENITLVAKWKKKEVIQEEVKEYNVKFESDGKVVSEKTTVQGKVEKPADPSKTGYDFVGWYLNDNEFNFLTSITEDTTIVAKFTQIEKYKVTFNTDGGNNIAAKEIEKNKTVAAPANPTKNLHKFIKWTLDGKDYDFKQPVTDNITLEAVWEKLPTVKVSFNTDGGNSIATKEIEKNKPVSSPTNPTKSGYVFKYWTLDGNKYDFKSNVANDITLKAEWRALDVFNVEFDSGIGIKRVVEGNTVAKPTDPTKEGYIFDYWTLNGNKYDFNTKVTSSLSLVAKWKQKTYFVEVSKVDDQSPARILTAYEGNKVIDIVEFLYSDGVKICNASNGKGNVNMNAINGETSFKLKLSGGTIVTATLK